MGKIIGGTVMVSVDKKNFELHMFRGTSDKYSGNEFVS